MHIPSLTHSYRITCRHAIYEIFKDATSFHFIWFSVYSKKSRTTELNIHDFGGGYGNFVLFSLIFGIGLLMKQLKHFWCCRVAIAAAAAVWQKQPHNISIATFTKSIKFPPYRSFAFEISTRAKKITMKMLHETSRNWNEQKSRNICAVYTILWILPFNWSCRCSISFHFIDCTILIDQQFQ